MKEREREREGGGLKFGNINPSAAREAAWTSIQERWRISTAGH